MKGRGNFLFVAVFLFFFSDQCSSDSLPADHQLTSNVYTFQDHNDISYEEGLIGVRLPVRGRGKLFDEVSEEWRKTGEESSINVGLYHSVSYLVQTNLWR